MLKTSTGKIYTLLSACKPESERVKKRLLITKIMEMPEYRALQVYSGAISAMDDHYGPNRLQSASYKDLMQIEQIIPFLEDCIRKLYEVICYGDVRKIFSVGSIKFYDAESMKNLYRVVQSEERRGINITNIPEYDVWSLFAPDTIIQLDKCWNSMEDCDINCLETEIPNKLANKVYCISSVELTERRREYLGVYRKEETVRLRLQIVENKIFVKKIVVSLLTMAFMMDRFSNSSGVLNPAVRGLFLTLYIVTLITYWIMG